MRTNIKSGYISGAITVILVFLLFCPSLLNYADDFINKVTAQILVYGLSTVIMVMYCMNTKYIRLPKDRFWTFVFIYLIFLFIRLCNDYVLTGEGNFLYKTPQTVMFFYIFPILMPAVFFMITRFELSVIRTTWWIIGLLTVCMLLSYIAITSGAVNVSLGGGFDSGYDVFTIEYGHYGASLALISLYLIKQYKCNLKLLLILIPCFLLGVTSIAFAGSRGPFIAFIICLLFWYLSSHSLKSSLFLCLIIVLAGSVLIELLYFINDLLSNRGIDSFSRILDSVFADDGLKNHTSGRDMIYKIGLQRFLENPIFGCSLFIPGMKYVHNIVLEQFMSLGFVGGTIFVIFNIIAFIRASKLIRINSQYTIISILFIQYFVFGLFSSTIISLPIYWLTLFLINNYWDNFIKPMANVQKINKTLLFKL